MVYELPHGKKAVGSRWVPPYKSDKNGQMTKTKARLVAKGFMQGEGLDDVPSNVCAHARSCISQDCDGCCQ